MFFVHVAIDFFLKSDFNLNSLLYSPIIIIIIIHRLLLTELLIFLPRKSETLSL